MNPVYLISSVHTSEFGNEPFIQTPSLYRWGNWGVPTARVGETWIREPACQGSWEWGVEDPVPNLFSLLRVPYCGQRGEGESGAGLNSDGFLTQHTVTCSEVRLLWGHKRDILPVLNVQSEQCWMPFKMHFTPRHEYRLFLLYGGSVEGDRHVCPPDWGPCSETFFELTLLKLGTSLQIRTPHLTGSGCYSPERCLVETRCSDSKCSQTHVPPAPCGVRLSWWQALTGDPRRPWSLLSLQFWGWQAVSFHSA